MRTPRDQRRAASPRSNAQGPPLIMQYRHAVAAKSRSGQLPGFRGHDQAFPLVGARYMLLLAGGNMSAVTSSVMMGYHPEASRPSRANCIGG